MDMNASFWVHCLQVGTSANFCMTHAHVWVDGVPGVAHFGGDAYWQWMLQPHYPYRNHETGFCWAQALFMGLTDSHKEAFLRCEEFCVRPTDADYAHVAHVLEEFDSGVTVPKGF